MMFSACSRVSSAAGLLVAVSFVCAAAATPQDSSSPSASSPVSLRLPPEVQGQIDSLRGRLQIALNAGDLQGEALLLDRIGAIYYGHANPSEALLAFTQVLAVVRKLHSPVAEATALCDI